MGTSCLINEFLSICQNRRCEQSIVNAKTYKNFDTILLKQDMMTVTVNLVTSTLNSVFQICNLGQLTQDNKDKLDKNRSSYTLNIDKTSALKEQNSITLKRV